MDKAVISDEAVTHFSWNRDGVGFVSYTATVFYLLYDGPRVTLSDVYALEACLCPIGKTYGLTVSIRPFPGDEGCFFFVVSPNWSD